MTFRFVRGRTRALLGVLFVCGLPAGCVTVKSIRPPVFDHGQLIRRFFERERTGHYPLTAQRGWNVQPAVTKSGAMFYTSNLDGSTDIWLRDLNSTVNVQLVTHDAEQHSPAVTGDGRYLVFVSEDRDARGELRLFDMPSGPGRIISAVLEGTILSNFWADTVNLSERIQKQAGKLSGSCRERAGERSPAWSPQGDYLYFVSDRCTPRRFEVWRVRMAKGQPVAPPEQVTRNGGDEPAPSGDGRLLAFTGRSGTGGRTVFVLETARPGSVREVPLPRGTAEAPFLYRSPSLDGAGRLLYYATIRQDTNRNGVLDPRDDSTIFSLDLGNHGAREKRMLEGAFPVAGVTYTSYLDGVVLYAASLYNSLNIYLMPPYGIIPREADIFEQYRFAQKYRTTSIDRYFLALDAVRVHWGHQPQFAVYEGRLLLDKLRRLKGETNRQSEQVALQRELSESVRQNPFTDLLVQTDARESRGLSTAYLVQAFVDGFAARHARAYPESARQEVLGAALETLGLAYLVEGRIAVAHRVMVRLVRDFPDYSRALYAKFLLARVELRQTGRVPPSLLELASQPKRLPPRMVEGVSAVVYNSFYSPLRARQALERADRELQRTDLPQIVRVSLLLVRARVLYDLDRFEESIAVARTAAEQAAPRSGSFVRAWQSIAFASEKLGRYADAYDAKLKYGGAYSEETGAQVTEDEYLEIIEESERQIEGFVRTARSLSTALADADLAKAGVRRVLKIDGGVRAGGLDREMVREFCRRDSQSWRLLTVLGRNGARYVKFCEEAATGFAGAEPVQAELVRTAVDLLYIGAYGAAARLNIMFLYMRSVDLFPELYTSRAIYYHRLKVDLAIEHNRRKLEWAEQRIQLLDTGDLQNVLEVGDPFDSTAFDALVDGYNFSLGDALRFDDMSLLYGYAYTLVRKSVQREEFYDRLARSTLSLRPERLADYKQAVLRDLKTAEYYLRYIIYRRPNEADAYLLLGWLQQYIDDRRASTVSIPDTFLESVVQYVTGTKSARPTDGRLFKDLYDGFFQERLYEANVELYQQALDRTRGSPLDQAHLNLNLANNYFRLLNFKMAVEHYDLASTQMRRTERPIFRDYVQEALFYYNRGRALFYQGESANAAVDFERAYQLYDREERKPLFEEFSRLRYEKLSFQISKAKDSYDLLLKKEKLLLERVQRVNFKMALSAAMLGLAQWESGQLASAVDAYEDAENRLYGGADPGADAVGRSNLRNFMAMALQDQGLFRSSDESAKAAAEHARKKGLSANRERFEPESIISRLMGCLLNYGEDFSVIGAGRNPFGFSPLRSYELSLGIRLENRVLLGDLEGAEALIAERRAFFRSNDASVRQGRTALVTASNMRAYHHFEAGRFLEAVRYFGEAAKEAQSFGFAREAQLNLRNRTQVLFVALDRGLVRSGDALSRLDSAAAELAEFRAVYAAQARAEYVKKQKPGFEFTPEHEGILAQIVQRDLAAVVSLQALCRYYRGRVLEEEADTEGKLHLARVEYVEALKALVAVSRLLAESSSERIRAEVNLGRVELHLGRLHAAYARLQRAQERSFELGMLREEWAALEGMMDAARALAEIRPQGSFRGEAIDHARAAVALLRKEPELFFEWLPRVGAFYDRAASLLIEVGLDREALQVLEQKHQHEMQREYVRFPLRFQDEQLAGAYRGYRESVAAYVRLREAEGQLRASRGSLEQHLASLKQNRSRREEHRRTILARAPGHSWFLGFREGTPALRSSAMLLRLFRHGGTLHVWQFANGSADFVSVTDTDPSRAFSEALRRFRRPERALHDLFVIADPTTFGLRLADLLKAYEPRWPAPVFLTRVPLEPAVSFFDERIASSDSSGNGHRFNVRVLKRLQGDKDYEQYADVVSAGVPRGQGTFPVPMPGRLNVRLWFEKERPASVVLLDGRADYGNAAGLAEVLFASGASTVIFGAGEGTAARVQALAGRARYTEVGGIVFGSAGYVRAAARERARARAARLLERGRAVASSGPASRAGDFFSEAVSLAVVSGSRSLELESRLLEAEQRTLDSGGREGRAHFDALLRDFPVGSDSVRIIRILLRSFYRVNQGSVAQNYLSAWKRKHPKQLADVARAAEVLDFVNRLQQLKYPGDRKRFAADYRRLFADLAGSGEAAGAVDALSRRTLYSRAIELAGAAGRSGVRGTEEWAFVAAREAALLGQRTGYVGIPAGLRGPPLLLALSEQGRWKDYEKAAKELELEGGASFALVKFRRRLFAQWRLHTLERQISIQDVADVAVDVGVTAYQRISRLERCMVLAMLLRATEYDPELLTAQNLSSLVKVERRTGTERAARMALLAARRYLAIADPLSASTFLMDYERLCKQGLPEAEQTALAARTGAALEVAGIQRMITTSSGRKELQTFRSRWAQALSGDRERRLAAVYFAIPKKFTETEIQLFNQRVEEAVRGGARMEREWFVIGGLLKQRAIELRNWPAALDAALFTQSVRRLSARGRREARRGLPKLSRTADRLRAVLPANQTFTALVDTNARALRLQLRNGAWSADELSVPGRFLRGRLLAFLETQRLQEGGISLYRELSPIYRTLFPPGGSGVRYYWFEGVHAFAPIPLERGDRIYQVLDPEVFAREVAVAAPSSYAPGFQVEVSGGARAADRWTARLLSMERMALGEQATSPRYPLHLMQPVEPPVARSVPRLHAGVSTLNRSYFVASTALHEDVRGEVAAVAYLMGELARIFSAPGVLALRRPHELAHPYFVRFFYDRSFPAHEIDKRFAEATLRLRRVVPNESATYGYRLVTSRIIREDRAK